jgi:hypothetical protein
MFYVPSQFNENWSNTDQWLLWWPVAGPGEGNEDDSGDKWNSYVSLVNFVWNFIFIFRVIYCLNTAIVIDDNLLGCSAVWTKLL